MNMALSELAALGRKAARGAGFAWGVADEVGAGLAWLHGHGLDGAGALAAYLAKPRGARPALPFVNLSNPLQPPQPLPQPQHLPLCPIMLGLALSDFAHQRSLEDQLDLGQVSYPVLTLPFLSDLADRLDAVVQMSGDQSCILHPKDGLTGTPPLAETSDLHLRFGPATPGAHPANSRAVLSPETYARLDKFAALTYAPATEASRLAGAGAGLTDND